MRITISASILLLVSSCSVAFAQSDAQFEEAMAVCDNMTMYVEAAKRQRTVGMPLDVAKELVSSAMQKNLNMPADLKDAAIDLVKKIYDNVYGQESVSGLPVERVLSETCGKYRGYSIPESRVKEHVASTTQSAWDPLARVPLCTKVAQSASNIGAARDRGMSREAISTVAVSSLKNDPFTLARLPALLDVAYGKPSASISHLFGYSLFSCRAEQQGRSYPKFESLQSRLTSCSGTNSKAEQEKCEIAVFRTAE
jgi:hypothetical protein